MGRSGNPHKREARQISAKQRQEKSSATTAQETPATVVPDITEAPSRAQVQLQELPEHWKNPCKDPTTSEHKDTPSDCFWITPPIIYNKPRVRQEDHATAA